MLCISFPSQIFQHSQHFPTTRGSTIAAWCWPVCRWSCKILGHWRYHGATACWDLDRKSQLLGAGLPCILGAWFSWQNIYNVQCVLVYYHLSLLMMMMMMIIVFTIIIYYSHLLFILFKCVLLVYYYYYSLFMVCYTFIIYHALFSIYYYYYSYFTCYYLIFTNYLSFIMYYYVLFTIYYLLSIIYYNMWCVYIYMYRDVYQVRYSIHLILTQQVSPFFSLGFE